MESELTPTKSPLVTAAHVKEFKPCVVASAALQHPPHALTAPEGERDPEGASDNGEVPWETEKNGQRRSAKECGKEVKGGEKTTGGAPPDGGWGWVVLLGSFVVMVLISSMGPCFSLVYSRLLLSFGSSSTTVAWIFNTFSLVWNVMGPVVGPLTAECGHRKVAVTGALLCSLALIFSAFSSSAWMLLLTFSLIGGVGAGLVVGASVLILPLYFSRRRGFANGLFMAGTSVGLFIAPHLITYLQDLYTFKGATLILGAIVLNGCAAGSTYHPISWHMQHQRKSSSNITEESQRKPLTKTINKNNPLGTSELLNGKHQIDKDAPRRRCFVTRVVISTVRDLGILQSSRALIIALTSTLVMNGYLNFIMMVPFIVTKGKHTPYDAAWCVSVSGISNLLTRVIVSALADCSWFHLRACYMAGILLIALSSLAFSFIPSLAWMTVTMAVWGCGVGAFMGLYNLIMIRYMGMKKLPSMYGASSLLNGLGFITIGPLIGYIRDLSGSYQVSLWVLVVTEALCVFLWFLMPAAAARDNRKALEREQGGLQ
ncbi:monocarboxylate transporter 12-B-like [Penaeus monodon]|uniref:monocarboxylate transporter 12-B-like n=1 Tax=Penaeus monodon TaxID=6687 RepID=UPI0018A74CDD|nr:monocarboxylate transporter 12-B-like [Penaeus monodon]